MGVRGVGLPRQGTASGVVRASLICARLCAYDCSTCGRWVMLRLPLFCAYDAMGDCLLDAWPAFGRLKSTSHPHRLPCCSILRPICYLGRCLYTLCFSHVSCSWYQRKPGPVGGHHLVYVTLFMFSHCVQLCISLSRPNLTAVLPWKPESKRSSQGLPGGGKKRVSLHCLSFRVTVLPTIS